MGYNGQHKAEKQNYDMFLALQLNAIQIILWTKWGGQWSKWGGQVWMVSIWPPCSNVQTPVSRMCCITSQSFSTKLLVISINWLIKFLFLSFPVEVGTGVLLWATKEMSCFHSYLSEKMSVNHTSYFRWKAFRPFSCQNNVYS